MTTEEAFASVAVLIDSVVVWLPCQASTIKLRGGCPVIEKAHDASWRVHAHALHRLLTICVAQEIEDLPDEHKLGIFLHEFGHIYGGPDEADADLWVEENLGIDLRYVDTIQWVPVKEVLG